MHYLFMVPLSRHNLFVKVSVAGKRENKRNKRLEVPCVVNVTVPFHEVRSNNLSSAKRLVIYCYGLTGFTETF